MTRPFEQNLAKIRNVSVAVAANDIYDSKGSAEIIITFSDGTSLAACYWRLIQGGRPVLSSFDHQQQYGLPEPIRATEQVASLLEGKICSEVQFNRETGDLTLVFDATAKLQVFNFTGYEIWEIRFKDGTGQYSNYALA